MGNVWKLISLPSMHMWPAVDIVFKVVRSGSFWTKVLETSNWAILVLVFLTRKSSWATCLEGIYMHNIKKRYALDFSFIWSCSGFPLTSTWWQAYLLVNQMLTQLLGFLPFPMCQEGCALFNIPLTHLNIRFYQSFSVWDFFLGLHNISVGSGFVISQTATNRL